MLASRTVRRPTKRNASHVLCRRCPAGVSWTRWARFLGVLGVGSASLMFDQVPNRITNERRATFAYLCTPLDVAEGDDCAVKWSLDSGNWRYASTEDATVTVQGLSDGVHSLKLQHEFSYADGRPGADNQEYTWTVDTAPPDTIVDTGPSQEGEAPRPEEADPFLFFTFHCSEDSCQYRYQFDNLIELTATTWDATEGNGMEGQVSVTQAGGVEEEGSSKIQISVFLTVASSYSDPDDPQLMPATVSIFNRVGNVVADGDEGDGDGADGDAAGSGGSGSNGDGVATEASGNALVVLTLGSPEVDKGTGNTVFSLSAEEEVPGVIELNSSLFVEVSTNSSVLLATASLEESITSKEWLRWPYASELPGSHSVAIAAVDEAGNVDPDPAVWTWSVDARPRTSLDSAPQAVSPVDTAFFSFSCALPGAEPSEQGGSVSNNLQSASGDPAVVDTDEEEEEEDGERGENDGGWEIQEGGECTYFYALDGGSYSVVEETGVGVAGEGGGDSSADAALTEDGDGGGGQTDGDSAEGEGTVAASSTATTTNTLLLTSLSDGVHELSVFACKTNSSECDPQPLSHSWRTDTSTPVTSIVSFPDKLTPSEFTFASSKLLSRFVCRVDGGQWRECQRESRFPLTDGMHELAVMAVDPTGRSDPHPVHYGWEVSMLETAVEYCPASHIPFDAVTTEVILRASYSGVPCPSAMDCQVRYTLDWEAPAPAPGGNCAAPPTSSPTQAPSPPSPSPVTGTGGGGNASGNNGGSASAEGGGSGGVTPSPADGGGGGGGGAAVVAVPQESYLSSAVRCSDAWANCTTLRANGSYEADWNGQGCSKLETVVGQVRHSHATLVMRNLLPGSYNLTLEALDNFGGVDRSPVVCPFQVLAEGETVNQTQVILTRTPAKVMDDPAQTSALFEFGVDGSGEESAATTTTASPSTSPSISPSSSNSSLPPSSTAAPSPSPSPPSPRLSYLLSGPGTGHDWEPVPEVPSEEWAVVVKNNTEGGGGVAGDEEGGGGGIGEDGSSSDAVVWGLLLEDLDDGEYRLKVRDNVLGATVEYTWKVDMTVPELTVDASPQSPSHSAAALFVLRCSKLSCGLEYQLNGEGAWHQWDSAAAEVEHGHRSGAPTPSPASALWPSMGDENNSDSGGYGDGGDGGSGSDSGGENDDSEDGGGGGGGSDSSGDGGGAAAKVDDVTVFVSAEQVSSHELSFRVHVTVPHSGNYTLAARPLASTATTTTATTTATPSSSSGGDRRRLAGSSGSDSTVTLRWKVDLTRPETKVIGRPAPVTTAGEADFQFACLIDGEEPRNGCSYEYQIGGVGNVAEVDWSGRGWLPTADSVLLYEIGEGVNMIRVRAQVSPDLYDLAPAEVRWIRDATAPELQWKWTPEETSHRSDALFEFTCVGELLTAPMLLADEDGDPAGIGGNANGGGVSSSFVSSSAAEDYDDSAEIAAASLAAAYPSAFPRVLPSGCAFEASLDGADFEAVPNAVSLTGLSDGPHRFSVRASDLAGNVAPTSHFDWTVDTNIPDTVLIAGPATTASSTFASVRILDSVEAAAGRGHFEYRLDASGDGAPWVSTSNSTLLFDGIEDGWHTLTVRAREHEEAGGSSDKVPEVVTWTVDTACPDTTFVVLPDVVTHLTSEVLVVEGGPDAVRFEYALDEIGMTDDGEEKEEDQEGDSEEEGDGGGESSGSSSSLPSSASSADDKRVWQTGDASGVIHLHRLQEGRHEVRVRAVDSAGNADPSPATYSWIVDRAGVYGHPSMVTNVVAEGGNKQAFVQWAAAADDGGGALTKYVVIASTAYADIDVEAITSVPVETAGTEPPTEATVLGLTNGLVYSFQVVAANAFGFSAHSLPSNKVVTYDPTDPCGLVTCGDHGSCFIQRSQSNALRGYCVCRPGYSGSDCSVVASGSDDSSVVRGAYPGSWGECDMKCGGGIRYRNVQCVEYLEGVPMSAVANDSSCWRELGEVASETITAEGSCRHIACLAMFLDVKMRLHAFYDDACFTVAAQDAFLSGFAAEVAHALNIKVELVIDLNAFHTDKHNEMEVRFIIAPGQSGSDQPIENLREQLLLQAASDVSSFRTHGTWTRKLIPDSVEVSQGTYELPSLNVQGIASDLVKILMAVGTMCLGVAVYGACSSRRSKKWDSVYDGEYGRDTTASPGPSNGQDGGGRSNPGTGGNNDDNSNDNADGASTGGSGSVVAGAGGGGGAGSRRNRWFELDSDDSDSDWEEDEEDETSPFFGRCALRSLLCREDPRVSMNKGSGGSGDSDINNSSRNSGNCSCTGECGARGAGAGAAEVLAERGCDYCSGRGGEDCDVELQARPPGSAIDLSGVDVAPFPLTGRNRPPPLSQSGEVNLHRRRRGWGMGAVGGSEGTQQDSDTLSVQRPGRQAMV